MAKRHEEIKTLGDILEKEMCPKKPRRRLTIAERMKAYSKPWSKQRVEYTRASNAAKKAAKMRVETDCSLRSKPD